MISLTGSVITPVKSYTTSEHRLFFFPAGIYCFGFDDFHSFFYNNNDIFNGVIHPDFHVFSVEILFHSIGNFFHRVPYIMNFKVPLVPDLEAELDTLCLRARRPLLCLWC